MASYILIALAVLVVGFIVFVATRPAAFRIERTAHLPVPASVVFTLLNDFHQWGRWSPFEKLDPNAERRIDGAPTGVGARYAWKGNNQMGEGRLTIQESLPEERVRVEMVFLKPFSATSYAVFLLVPDGKGTKVTWRMEGDNGFMGKAFTVLLDVDSMQGKNFEEGLARLGAAGLEDMAKHAVASAESRASGH
ncbi:SRPBCC family protein [Corallococcus sp. M34]|uniref:SRPBCC family protein n=1 Tax=Citreicoccus inhibens TaxID=2849499 RepID=UPI001C21E58B|nr:SRPBCC family protein [Citreicoccus inhibens]MBU8895431.1 SRPBCC family protein [Citreicoccus inhibens]